MPLALLISRLRAATSFKDVNFREGGMSTILLIVILILVLGGGGGYYGFSRYGGRGLGGVLGLLLLVLIVLWLLGALQGLSLGRM
jgi:hypothetical protein